MHNWHIHLVHPLSDLAELGNLLVFREAETNYRPFFRSWISVALTDPCAFYITLSNAAMRLSRVHMAKGNNLLLENHEDLDFYTRSVHAAQVRLQKDPSDEGLIGTVLGLACRDVRIPSFRRIELQKKPLNSLIM